MKDKSSLDLKNLPEQFGSIIHKISRYAILLFLILLALIYGFLFTRINTLSKVEPNDTEVSDQVKASPITHVDPNVVKQLKQLQDNSVSVQALFNQARTNPFQE